MARNRRKKALYEVISQSRPVSGYGKPAQKAPGEKPVEDEPAPVEPAVTSWPRKPSILQFNAGRIEISLPYPIAIAVLLGVVLVLLVTYRLGQKSYSSAPVREDSGSATGAIVKDAGAESATAGEASMSGTGQGAAPVEQKGSNRIVIQGYRLRTHLQPVKEYFESFGIETEIKRVGEWYYLVTKERFEKNPDTKGTDGYEVKQRIIELGAKYKADPGYESFGPKPFHDAYGMKFDD